MNMLKQFIAYIQKILFGDSAGMLDRWIRHLLAGGIGTVLYFMFTFLMVEIFHFHPVFAVLCSSLIVIIYTYLINRLWVYNSTNNHFYAIPRYIIVVLIAIGLNSGIMYVVVEVIKVWYVYGLFISIFIVPPTNFLLNYYWAFK